METIIITRHPGAINFINSLGFEGETVEHFEPEMAHSGILCIGILPIHLIATILQNGGRYMQVILPQLPPELRGVELTAEQMIELGAQLIEITGIQMVPV